MHPPRRRAGLQEKVVRKEKRAVDRHQAIDRIAATPKLVNLPKNRNRRVIYRAYRLIVGA